MMKVQSVKSKKEVFDVDDEFIILTDYIVMLFSITTRTFPISLNEEFHKSNLFFSPWSTISEH